MATPTAASTNGPGPKSLARQIGHKFKGYQLTEDQRPTFFYQIDGLAISDFPNPVETATSVSLRRTITITGDAKSNTFLRLAVGTIRRDGEVFDLGDDLQLRIMNAAESSAQIRNSGGLKELFIPVPKGETKVELEYIW